MGRKLYGIWVMGAAAALSVCVGACGSSSHKTSDPAGHSSSSTTATTLSSAVLKEAKEGNKLLSKIITVPFNYVQSTTSGETGTITSDVFEQMGAASKKAKDNFVIGYRQDYVTDPDVALASDPDHEGLSITVLQFRTPQAASGYLESVKKTFLSLSAPTYKPYTAIPDAEEADYTKAAGGGYAHAVVMAKGDYFALFEYANYKPSQPPSEFPFWVAKQYSLL